MRKLIVIVFTFFLLSSGMMTAVGIDAIEWNEKTNQIAENVQEIKDWHDLDEIRDDLDKGYLLMDNLDEDTEGYDELVDSVNGWNPINDFTGSFDGNGHKIFDLYVNRPNTDYVGLFGYTDDAELSDVGLIDVDINGDNYIGTLVGDKRGGTISRSYTTGDVSGDEYVGGLVGHNTGTVSNSYTLANVNGDWRIGGLTGWNFLESTVENSYAAGEVNGESEAGSIVGYNTGTISDSFSLDSPLIGEDGGSRQGRVAEADESEMKDYPLYTQVSYSDYDDLEEPWDFVGDPNDDEGDEDIWDIDEEINDGYPFLTWKDEEEIPDEYELTVHIEGEGSVEVDGQEVYNGWTGEFGEEEVELVANADEGWAFDGWTGDYEGYESVVEITMDEDKQITANFYEPEEWYTLEVYIVGKGSVEVEGEEVSYGWSDDFGEGEVISLEAFPEDGYKFDEWKIGAQTEKEKEITLEMNEDKWLFAYFIEEPIYDNIIDWDPEAHTHQFGNYDTIWGLSNCYGFAATEILYYKRYVMNNDEMPYFPSQETKASTTNELVPPLDSDIEDTLNNVTLSIMMHQITQQNKPGDVDWESIDLDAQFNKINNTLSDGEPLLLGLGPENYHAVVVWGVEIYEDQIARLSISDSNSLNEVKYGYYDKENQDFTYDVDFQWDKFQAIRPEIMKRNRFFRWWHPRDWFEDWTDIIIEGYDLIVGDKDMVIECEDGNINRFETVGNSQTFQHGIPGSAGITEGDIVVFAIPDEIEYEIDPLLDDDSFVYMYTVKNNENGEKEFFSYHLNLSSDTSYEYAIDVEDLSQGIDFTPIDSKVEIEPTITYAGPDGDYQIFQASDIWTEEGNRYEFIIDEWDQLNSTEKETVRVEVYGEDYDTPIASYGLSNGQEGLEPDMEDDDTFGFLFNYWWLLIIVAGVIGFGALVLVKKKVNMESLEKEYRQENYTEQSVEEEEEKEKPPKT